LAEVLRDFSVLKGRKILSFGERKMLELARSLLVQELCVALEKTEDEVNTIIDDSFADVEIFSND
jgi:CarD family transcriptional regulator